MEWITSIKWPDLLVIIIVLKCTYSGSQRGFFGELFHIFGICLAIICGTHFYSPIAIFFNTYVLIPFHVGNILSFGIVAFCCFILFNYIYGLLQKIIKVEMLPLLNKIGGPVLGFFKGMILCSFIFFIMLLTPINY